MWRSSPLRRQPSASTQPPMTQGPDEFLDAWIGHASIGRALDLGAGQGEVALWLAGRGFTVDAVECNRRSYQRLLRASRDMPVRPLRLDIRHLAPATGTYHLITAFAVFHFLRPSELRSVGARLSRALVPGGLLLATVFTVDDPGYHSLITSGAPTHEVNTFRLSPSVPSLHYFEPGELAALFEELRPLAEDRYRWVDPSSERGFHAGARFAARCEPAPGV